MCAAYGLDLNINRADENAVKAAALSWDHIMKPLGSLGELEALHIKLCGIFGTDEFSLSRRCVLMACADNGVVCEGVTQCGSEVTVSVATQTAKGRSNINAMADAAGAQVFAIDFGMLEKSEHPGVIDMRLGEGTGNIAKGPAMSRETCLEAIKGGMSMVKSMRFVGYDIMVTGEMGIGNTTTSAAVASVLLGRDPAELAGRGAGLDTEGYERKLRVIAEAIKVNSPDASDPIDVLAKLGGFDIAAMTGMFLGGMENRVPIVIDGFISATAALVASRIVPECTDFMIPSHLSSEKGTGYIMEALSMSPVINAGLRLGEGTGGVCLLPLLDLTLAEYKNAHRFGDTQVEQYERLT